MEIDEEDNILDETNGSEYEQGGEVQRTISVSGMYKEWFLDYASYVILERAVPDVNDGLKPVQRRIMHSMKELDDGRYNKVANIIGNTMKYHPHGDASIGDALVQLGQKDLLVDCQGNWGNIYTGDSAAAPRYIEARLSKFANEVVFNAKTTVWQSSYDGRNKEPVALPVKFPLLLAQGVEGIAVGLACKILPHNFIELIDASINYLKGTDTELFPDFVTGGMIDVSRYNDGLRGGKIRIRSKISQVDKKTLVIKEIPFGTTTTQLIESVLTANEKGKIKIRKIEDNTAANVEIMVHLNQGVSPDLTIDALYAFTDCEVSISPNACVIDGNKPRFIGVKEMLRISADNTVRLLKLELEISLSELEEKWHFASLERIFIEKRIYRKIEESETWEAVIESIDKGLKPYKKIFKREITREDILRLTEIKIKRISKFDLSKAEEAIKDIEIEIDEVKNNLDNLIDYAIYYYKQIKKKYGEGRERKTEIRNFDTIEATMVAAANEKLYVNREEGFAGTGLKKDEYVSECSDIDDIIVFRGDGTFIVTKVADKVFIGKDILHIAVYKRNDTRTIYNLIYQDGLKGKAMVKRFAVDSVIRDKEYFATKGTKDSKVLYFTVNPNGEAEVVIVYLVPKPKLRKLQFDFDFSTITVKGRNSMGNTLTKYRVRKINLKDEGVSTLSARKIWFDDTVLRLNAEERGKYLGEFSADDKIISVMQSGNYRLTSYDLATHFDEDLILIEKYQYEKIYTAIYVEGETGQYYMKRFNIEASDKKMSFIGEHPASKLMLVTNDLLPKIEIEFKSLKFKAQGSKLKELIICSEFIGVKSFKAKGKRLTTFDISKINLLEPILVEETQDTSIKTEDNSKVTQDTRHKTQDNEKLKVKTQKLEEENIEPKSLNLILPIIKEVPVKTQKSKQKTEDTSIKTQDKEKPKIKSQKPNIDTQHTNIKTEDKEKSKINPDKSGQKSKEVKEEDKKEKSSASKEVKNKQDSDKNKGDKGGPTQMQLF